MDNLPRGRVALPFSFSSYTDVFVNNGVSALGYSVGPAPDSRPGTTQPIPQTRPSKEKWQYIKDRECPECLLTTLWQTYEDRYTLVDMGRNKIWLTFAGSVYCCMCDKAIQEKLMETEQ